MKRYYGRKKDVKDERDFKFCAGGHLLKMLNPPSIFDERISPYMPAVYDQLQLGSCTGHGWAGAMHFDRLREGFKNVLTPSRLMIYFCERTLGGTVSEDAGASVRDGAKAIAKWGFCDEGPAADQWSYDIAKFTQSPPTAAWGTAYKRKNIVYHSVPQSLTQIQAALMTKSLVVFGFDVPANFEGEEMALTGSMPLSSWRGSSVGGHCVDIVGWDLLKQVAIVRNSWDKTWGDKGYFYMPLSVVLSGQCSDFWVCSKVPV